MDNERDVAHQINRDLGLNPGLEVDSDKRLEKIRELREQEAEHEETEDP